MKHFKKIFILSFVLCLVASFAIPKVLANKSSVINTNADSIINIIYNRVNEEYDNEQNNGVQPRHVSNNPTGNRASQDFTTWAGIVLLSIIILVAIRTLPLQKRL